MNYLKNTLISLLLFGNSTTFACDICGCFMGITPYDNQSNVGILYRYRSFNGYEKMKPKLFPKNSDFFIPSNANGSVPKHHHSDPGDYEIYRTVEVRGRYFIHQRLELNTIVPYNSNSSNYHEKTTTISGLGDVNVFAGYHLVRKLQGTGLSQRLITGAGFKLPTGKNNLSNTAGERYFLLNQPGTGSTDGFIYLNYLAGYKRIGMSWNAAYKLNGKNSHNERIGNSTTQFVNLFYTIPLNKDVKLIPSVQSFYEFSKGEFSESTVIKEDSHDHGGLNEHKMNNFMAGLGLDVFYKNIALNAGMQLNAYNQYTGHPRSAGKVHLGLTYNFKQLYYLINKK